MPASMSAAVAPAVTHLAASVLSSSCFSFGISLTPLSPLCTSDTSTSGTTAGIVVSARELAVGGQGRGDRRRGRHRQLLVAEEVEVVLQAQLGGIARLLEVLAAHPGVEDLALADAGHNGQHLALVGGAQAVELVGVLLLERGQERGSERLHVGAQLVGLLDQGGEAVDRGGTAEVGEDAAEAEALRRRLDEGRRIDRRCEERERALDAVEVLAVANLVEPVGYRVPGRSAARRWRGCRSTARTRRRAGSCPTRTRSREPRCCRETRFRARRARWRSRPTCSPGRRRTRPRSRRARGTNWGLGPRMCLAIT